MFSDKVKTRLEQERAIWMTTVRADGQPQSSVVWFLFEDEEILVYSKDGTIRNRSIVDNPRVALNLNSDGWGSEVVSMEGTARIDPDGPPASQHPAYLGKYLERFEKNGWTPDGFSKDYPVAIRVSVDRVRSW